MPIFEFEQLAAAAYHTERVRGRRLAARAGIGEADALRQVMTEAAGAAGLAALLAARAAASAADVARRAAKTQQRLEQRTARQQRDLPAAGTWQAWFDGSSHPNPGRLGIGALLCGPAGQRVEISRRAGHGNSSEAEYLALIAVLEAAAHNGALELVVCGDSRVVIDDVACSDGCGAKGLESHRLRAQELIAQLDKVSLRWLPRHRNGEADRLSQQAIALWQENGPAS